MSQFVRDQAYYEFHRERASAYCKELHSRLQHLRRQIKTLERAFVASATIKRKCEEEIIPIKVIPTGMNRKKAQEQSRKLMDRVKNDEVLKAAIRELLRKEGHKV